MSKQAVKLTLLSFVTTLTVASAFTRPESLAYGGVALDRLVQDSYHETQGKGKNQQDFYQWLEGAYAKSKLYSGRPLKQELVARGKTLATLQGDARVRYELEQAAWTHTLLKAILPTFSLQEGFEFRYAAERGKRQCLLQSILISSFLQKMGMEAGLVMVNRNPEGKESNNGHCAVLADLSNGRQVIVDASHPEPLAKHLGLMVQSSGGYRFVTPTYNSQEQITGYSRPRGGEIKPSEVQALDVAFLRSQTYFYRGERVPGGLIEGPSTPAGLARSEQLLEQAIAYCPGNQLAMYFLGRVEETQGKTGEARGHLLQAERLYAEAGWAPESVAQAVTRVSRAGKPE